MTELGERRLQHATSIMAVVNRQIDRLHGSFGLADSDFFCECGSPTCRERITISRSDFARLRDSERPLIVPAHARPSTAESTELETLREQVEQLERALVSRIRIEQAKGVLAERHGISLEAAFEQLRHQARSTRRKMKDVCAEMIYELGEAELAEPSADSPEAAAAEKSSDPRGR